MIREREREKKKLFLWDLFSNGENHYECQAQSECGMSDHLFIENDEFKKGFLKYVTAKFSFEG